MTDSAGNPLKHSGMKNGVWSRVWIPGGVRELCGRCFQEFSHLCHVTFGSSSSLERIGVSCFESTRVEELSIPNGVRELSDECFKGRQSFCSVTFESSSRLERIGANIASSDSNVSPSEGNYSYPD